ncbi:MAG: HypC/HybG/HupF family hydrogenase formation chaperone [Chthoniobacterales bacterium]
MNLVYGEITEVSSEDGIAMGKVRVRGAIRKIALGLLSDAERGDRILVCDGVAISKVAGLRKTEVKHVSRDSRKTH